MRDLPRTSRKRHSPLIQAHDAAVFLLRALECLFLGALEVVVRADGAAGGGELEVTGIVVAPGHCAFTRGKPAAVIQLVYSGQALRSDQLVDLPADITSMLFTQLITSAVTRFPYRNPF